MDWYMQCESLAREALHVKTYIYIQKMVGQDSVYVALRVRRLKRAL